jgi:hypothetical protein
MENKTGKYFKYAIGEIVLVVIGILIALQINNWNENRKQSNNELSLLASIKADLNFNLIEINGLRDATKSKIKSANILLSNLKNLSISEDSLKSVIEDISGGGIFNNANTTYKSIANNSGVTISNAELRKQLIKLYEQDFSNIHIRESYENQQIEDYYYPLILKHFKSSESIQKNLFGFTSKSINIPIDINQLSENNEFINSVVLITNQRETREYFLSETILTVEQVIKTIDSEIKLRE